MNNLKNKAKEILGADLNQSLHHLIGYWYAAGESEIFDNELACAMVDICLKEMSNPFLEEKLQNKIAERDKIIKKAIELIEFADTDQYEMCFKKFLNSDLIKKYKGGKKC